MALMSLTRRRSTPSFSSSDGTPQKKKLGGNTTIGVSIACAKAAAAAADKEVFEYLRTIADSGTSRETPFLFMNLMNGGKHGRTPLAFQEYHIVPQTGDIGEALLIGTAIQAELRERLVAELGPASANFGDEGGFVPDTASVRKPLELLADVVAQSRFGSKVRISLDVAASSFYKDGSYAVGGSMMTPAELADLYKALAKDFSLFSIEDPFDEEDFSGFAELRAATDVVIVGDDLTVTNAARLEEAIKNKSIGAMIVKPNQIGTLTETFTAMKLAQKNGVKCIVSHRSGETNDDFIADLAWAFGSWGLKAGAPNRGERVAKYNRLWEIQRGR